MIICRQQAEEVLEVTFMVKVMVFCLAVMLFTLSARCEPAATQKERQDVCPFQSSLHHTARGMAYWYDKANGGLESITNIPYKNLACNECHVSSCARCHIDSKGGERKMLYSSAAARSQAMCLECHGREMATLKEDRRRNQLDVHFAQGMECLDCHTAREMHGDGIPYVSMKQAGAMDAKCENCHDSITQSESHTVHNGKLDCKACHTRHAVSCANCHFDSIVHERKRRAIPLFDWLFLISYRNKITSANMQTFVYQGKRTFLMFAPQFTHSVMKPGRKCDECHGADSAKQLKSGALTLTWIDNGKLVNRKGLIPVVEGASYKSAYLDYRDGAWSPIENPEQPNPHYVGFGRPLSSEQLEKLTLTSEELKRSMKQAAPGSERHMKPKN